MIRTDNAKTLYRGEKFISLFKRNGNRRVSAMSFIRFDFGAGHLYDFLNLCITPSILGSKCRYWCPVWASIDSSFLAFPKSSGWDAASSGFFILTVIIVCPWAGDIFSEERQFRRSIQKQMSSCHGYFFRRPGVQGTFQPKHLLLAEVAQNPVVSVT